MRVHRKRHGHPFSYVLITVIVECLINMALSLQHLSEVGHNCLHFPDGELRTSVTFRHEFAPESNPPSLKSIKLDCSVNRTFFTASSCRQPRTTRLQPPGTVMPDECEGWEKALSPFQPQHGSSEVLSDALEQCAASVPDALTRTSYILSGVGHMYTKMIWADDANKEDALETQY